MSHKTMIRVACAFSCIAAASAGLQGQQVVAHVLDVKGEWHIQGSAAAVSAGQGLMPGARITAGSNRPGDAITIVHDENMSRQRTACDATPTNPCRTPINIENATSAPEGQSQFKNMVQTALAVLLNKPPAIGSHYALTLSRGHESVQEWEQVVSLGPTQQIDLPPAPPDWAAGHYTVAISRAGNASSATEQTVLLNSEGSWNPIPAGAPGLYEISIKNSDGDQVADAMLLAVQPSEFDSKQKAFEAMKDQTSTWTGPSARADEHLFLRAFLLTECASC